MPQLTPVTSSNISAIGYEGSSLYVWFKSGILYEYPGVPWDTYQALMANESVGRYFHQHIRNKFEYKRLTGIPGEYEGVA